MDKDVRRVVLDVAHGESDSQPIPAEVYFCESSASLRVGKLTVHIPWTELVQWQAWAAERVEEEA